MLTVRLLGGVVIEADAVPIALANRKARAILAYLAMNPPGQEQRERLAGLFWSESGEDKARATLRQAVHEMKEALLPTGHGAVLRSSRLVLALTPGVVQSDVGLILARLETGEVADELLGRDRLSESLLAGLEDLDPAFHAWLLAQRQILHDRLMRMLQDRYGAAATPLRQRRRFAEAARRLDPSDEEACRVYMRCLAEEGATIAALRTYNELWRLLDEDYDTEPSALTIQLVAEIKQGKFDPRPDDTEPAAVTARPAVLTEPLLVRIAAFGANGIAAERAHLVSGFRHELIACLAKFREWRLLDSAAGPLGNNAGQPSRTGYEVEATAYQAGASIQMVLTLRDAVRGIFVWSERFELRLESWFDTQRHIVRRIAVTMNGQVSAQRLHRIAGEPDVSLEVYDRWLRAQAMTNSFGYAEWQRAERLLEDTIAVMPGFSPVFSSLVQMRNTVHIVYPGVRRDPASLLPTLALARRAVELDPDDSRAHLCLGWSYAMAKKYRQAELHMGLACELNANDSWTAISAALFYAFDGNAGRAQALLRQSLEIATVPTRSHWAYDVSISYLAGDDEGTIAACDRAEDVILTLPAWKAAALHNLGRFTEARREAEHFMAIMRTNWFGEATRADSSIGQWLLHLYPISHPDNWERLRRGISGAGIPDEGTAHHAW